jgi:hypothetical protein
MCALTHPITPPFIQATLSLKYPSKVEAMNNVTFAAAVAPLQAPGSAGTPAAVAAAAAAAEAAGGSSVAALRGQLGCVHVLEDCVTPGQVGGRWCDVSCALHHAATWTG